MSRSNPTPRHPGLLLAAPLLALLGCSQADHRPDEPPAEITGMPGFAVLQAGVAAGGQPEESTFASLQGLGYRTVVNLRMPQEAPSPSEEAAWVRQGGLGYVQIPMTGGEFTLAQAAELGRVIEDDSLRPVLVHCRSGRRVHVLHALYRATYGGVPLEQAIEAARPFGLQGPLEERVRALAAEYEAAKAAGTESGREG